MVVTDGGDTVSRIDVHKALEAAQLADAVIYAIVVMPITNDAGRNIGGEHALEFMAKGTGGRTFMPTIGPELDKAFTAIITELRTQYMLGYYPQNVPLDQRPLPQAGSARHAARFAGFGAQRLLWGSRGKRAGSPEDRISRFPRQAEAATAAEKEALGETYATSRKISARAPEQTFEEAKYLKRLIENSTLSPRQAGRRRGSGRHHRVLRSILHPPDPQG